MDECTCSREKNGVQRGKRKIGMIKNKEVLEIRSVLVKGAGSGHSYVLRHMFKYQLTSLYDTKLYRRPSYICIIFPPLPSLCLQSNWCWKKKVQVGCCQACERAACNNKKMETAIKKSLSTHLSLIIKHDLKEQHPVNAAERILSIKHNTLMSSIIKIFESLS